MMISRLRLPVLLLAAVLAGGCAALRDDDSDDLVERLDEIVEESWEEAESTDELVEDYGPPERRHVERIVNRHDPSQTDEIWTVTYPGLEAQFYKAISGEPKEFLIGLWVTDARYDVGQYFKIGTTRARIERVFEDTCEPVSRDLWMESTRAGDAACDEDVCALLCGPERSTVLFKFTNQKVDRIDWDYHWE
jgi:hypothetical protein